MNKLSVGGVEIQTGDVLLVKNKGVLPFSIGAFMKIYRKSLGLHKNIPIYTHAAVIIELWGNWYVAEALSKGITIRPFMPVYGSRDADIALLRVGKGYTPEEKIDFAKYVCSFSFNPTRYDIVNFFYQTGMILRTTVLNGRKWKGKIGAEATKRLYCSEAAALWTNRSRMIFSNPASVNPMDIYINKKLSILHDGRLNKGNS